jgi:hypothetical protein
MKKSKKITEDLHKQQKKRMEKIGKKILKKARCRDFKKCEGVRLWGGVIHLLYLGLRWY